MKRFGVGTVLYCTVPKGKIKLCGRPCKSALSFGAGSEMIKGCGRFGGFRLLETRCDLVIMICVYLDSDSWTRGVVVTVTLMESCHVMMIRRTTDEFPY